MRIQSYREALREALAGEMKRDADVFLMGEDIGVYGGAFGVTRGLLDAFGPGRVINTPISEQSFTGTAVGAALAGSRPVAEIMFMDFITLAMDQIINQAAKLRYVLGPRVKCPLVIRTAAGGSRRYGPTHSQTLEACFMHIPGIKIATPATPADAGGLLMSAVRDDNPVLFIEHKSLYETKGKVPSRRRAVPFGKARKVALGDDLTVAAFSRCAVEAEKALGILAEDGIYGELIDLRTLNPLDAASVVDSVRRTGRLLLAEEGHRTGGVSAEIAFRVFEKAHDYLDAPIRRVTAPDVPIPASPVLEDAALPDAAKIVRAAADLVENG
ncbi:MAG: alpha-ketoacid dehydrogenase subunit beta [Kiritimatiellia bacterium]